jgi:hypothetical protein
MEIARLVWFGGMAVGVAIYIIVIVKYNNRMRDKIKEFFEQENLTYNRRGIHWTVFWGPKLQYIHIIFTTVP